MSVWVLLRGLTRERGHWGRFPQQLAHQLPGARILTLDLPGNGVLYRQQSPSSVPDMVQACRVQLHAAGVAEPCYVLAKSLGAMVAVAWADAHPDEIAGCVLVNTSFAGLSPWYQRLRPANYLTLLGILCHRDSRVREAAILRMTSRVADDSVLDDWCELRRTHPVSALNALRQLRAAARFRLPARRPSPPMLLLAGQGDMLVDPRCLMALARRWRLPLRSHPTAGHDLPLDDGPWVARQIGEWVTELEMQTPAGAGDG